jgi:hypothetical protein
MRYERSKMAGEAGITGYVGAYWDWRTRRVTFLPSNPGH